MEVVTNRFLAVCILALVGFFLERVSASSQSFLKHRHHFLLENWKFHKGLGPALSDRHHEKDAAFILELGATAVRLAHCQQADKVYSLCDEHGLAVWAEIPNTPAYRHHPRYLENCRGLCCLLDLGGELW